MVFTKNVAGSERNCGMYRLQVFDSRTTGMHWHVHHDGARHCREHLEAGRRMEVAVALGGDPALAYAATAPAPPGLDEMALAGLLRGRAVELVKCVTIDQEVPASADVVLEGYVRPGELRTEGPFGDHTGYYSPADEYPVFHLTAVTRRREPIWPATVVGPPPMEDLFIGKATERIFLPLVRAVAPEVVDISLPLFGVFHNWAFVSIRKTFPHQAIQTMEKLWGMGQMMFTKIIVVVDHDVDVQRAFEVLWRMGNDIDPERDVVFRQGPADALDHAAATKHRGGKMGVDATRKWPEEGFDRPWPDVLKSDEATARLVDERWEEYGLGRW
jgi:4-hydroxy-3-polyprenylbenzoate decarboxylase